MMHCLETTKSHKDVTGKNCILHRYQNSMVGTRSISYTSYYELCMHGVGGARSRRAFLAKPFVAAAFSLVWKRRAFWIECRFAPPESHINRGQGGNQRRLRFRRQESFRK